MEGYCNGGEFMQHNNGDMMDVGGYFFSNDSDMMDTSNVQYQSHPKHHYNNNNIPVQAQNSGQFIIHNVPMQMANHPHHQQQQQEEEVYVENVETNNEEKEQRTTYVPWTSDEDANLRKIVKEVSENQDVDPPESLESLLQKSKFWGKVAKKMFGRSAKQCRERWKNSLDPSITHEIWSVREDLMLLKIHDEVGNKWSQIASRLPGRTENGVKTRFKSICRARKRRWTSQEDALLLQLYRQHGPKWKLIQKALPKRSLHGVKIRYRSVISGTPEKPIVEGSPEQSLNYDFKTYFKNEPSSVSSSNEDDETNNEKRSRNDDSKINNNKVKKENKTKKFRPPTKKRLLIESLLANGGLPPTCAGKPNPNPALVKMENSNTNPTHSSDSVVAQSKNMNDNKLDQEEEEEEEEEKNCNGPCIIPGFTTTLSSSMQTVSQPSGKSSYRKYLLASPGKSNGPFTFCESNFAPEDQHLVSAVSDIIDTAKTNPQINDDELIEFEESLAEILADTHNPCPVPF